MSEPIDAAAFSALYRETSVDVLTFLLRRGGTADDAADSLGETYLGMSPTVVRVRAHRVRARIRSLLAGSDAEPGRETASAERGRS